MLELGLETVTLRGLAAAEVIEAAQGAGLSQLEWAGDVHAPAGDLHTAATVGDLTRQAGLEPAGYGSYWAPVLQAGERPPAGVISAVPEIGTVIDTASALGARWLRVWAGCRGSASYATAERAQVVEMLRDACERCAAAELDVVLEWHGGTPTNEFASARALIDEVAHPALRLSWQPRDHHTAEEALAELHALLADDLLAPLLRTVHVFWWDDFFNRHPLRDGAALWQPVLSALAAADIDAALLLEFVRDDAAASVHDDAATLRSWLTTVQ